MTEPAAANGMGAAATGCPRYQGNSTQTAANPTPARANQPIDNYDAEPATLVQTGTPPALQCHAAAALLPRPRPSRPRCGIKILEWGP